MKRITVACLALCLCASAAAAQDPWKPYSPPCTERENVFAFTEKPTVKLVGKDRYEIAFAVKGNCDVTVGIVDPDPAKELVKGQGVVVRHLASGVLGPNAPAPFQKGSLSQKIYWNGQDDLGQYVKEPAKLKVRVMLGLKPVFDKRIGGTSGKNIPGRIRGIAIGPDGAYVIDNASLFSHPTIRKFDHDGNYVCSLTPPPRGLPEKKLAGLSHLEYEPGKHALHGPSLNGSMTGSVWVNGLGCKVETIQPALAGDRLVFSTRGKFRTCRSLVHYIYTDGSTDLTGIRGLVLVKDNLHSHPRFTSSPDGKRVYVCGLNPSRGCGGSSACYTVWAHGLEPGSKAELFAGEEKPGRDNAHFGDARGLACDARGRVYVTDYSNNRIQVFSPDGKYLKTIRIERPDLICVHRKTGAIYVQHQARERGQSVTRITKLASSENPKEEFHWDAFPAMMALDSWSAKPRLWLGDGRYPRGYKGIKGPASLSIWEEREDRFEMISDFYEEAKKEAGKHWFGRFSGVGVLSNNNLVCDPTRERLHWLWGNRVFDLKTGLYLHSFSTASGRFEDIAFDKRGYMHGHQYPGQSMIGNEACVWRVDPERAKPHGKDTLHYPECPYDYGERRPTSKPRWEGALPARGQPGAPGFQHGLGVNMRGDVAIESEIFYVPKMGDEVQNYAMQGSESLGWYNEEGLSYQAFAKSIQEAQKRGMEVYSIRRKPGIALYGATLWTFDRSGELRKECAVVAGDLINGVEIDEDMSLYFTTARTRMYGDRWYLYGRGSTIGAPDDGRNRWPFTGTVIKTKPDTKCTLLHRSSPVPLDQFPSRSPDLRTLNFVGDNRDSRSLDCWVEGAEWMYAGASPMVSTGCVCPKMRCHLDWYKRTFVPEGHRHSFAVLDTNGNLVMHVGRYANFDSAPGGKDGCRPGGTDIGITSARYMSGTDNYLAFQDWGERLVVLKLDYHAEETCAIGVQ